MMNKQQLGFTIMELVTVIVLIGIVSLYVVPKFGGSSSFEAHSYRVQLISALRLTQQRAMQYTAETYQNSVGSVNICHHLVVDGDKYGVPNRVDCSITSFPNGWKPDKSGLQVDAKHQVSFSVQGETNPAKIGFDSLGRPSDDCVGGCIINVTSSEETTQIQIESEGYIHAID